MLIITTIIGLSAGILGGLVGIGGGVIMIPALIYLLHFNQHLAQGTTLAAMIPPIGILAAYEYYKSGNVNIPVAITLALGFIIGGYIGGKIAISLDNETLRRVFGIILFIMSLQIIFSK